MAEGIKGARGPRSSMAGFTLVELLAVLFIITMSTALVGVAIGNSVDKERLRQEVVGVRNLMAHARDLSLMQRKPVLFYATAEDGAYGIRGGKAYTLKRGLLFDGDAEVMFFPKGDSTGGEVGITALEGRAYSVQVDPVTGEAVMRRLQPR